MKNPILRSCLRLALFLAPIAVIFAYPVWVLSSAGEFLSPNAILRAYEKPGPETIIAPAHSDAWGFIKLQGVIQKRPEIVTLGTSRVLAFRDYFFGRPFYNAGNGARSIGQFRQFLDFLPPESRPKLLILGLDHNFFNPNWDLDWESTDLWRKPSRHEALIILATRWHRVYDDRFKGKFSEADILNGSDGRLRRIGLTALVQGAGMRRDGSYHWVVPEAKKFDRENQFIRDNQSNFRRGRTVSQRSVADFERLLDECRERGITVAAFLPPLAPTIYEQLLDEREDYGFVFGLGEALRPVFEKRGLAFGDFTDPASISADDSDFVDGQHTTSEAALRLWKTLTRAYPQLRETAGPPA